MTTYNNGAPGRAWHWYSPPESTYYTECAQLLDKAPHLLIAGASGSGKSVLLNNIIYSALAFTPNRYRFIFIDLKKIELIDYSYTPFCAYYADTPQKAQTAVDYAAAVMDWRYLEMQRRSVPGKSCKDYASDGTQQIYIVIDEYADLISTCARSVVEQIIRIAQLGRAAGVHIILATQRPTRDVIDGRIKVNLSVRIALRCASAQDSRNILDQPGAELLPRYGQALKLENGYITRLIIPKTPDAAIYNRVAYWIERGQAYSRFCERIIT